MNDTTKDSEKTIVDMPNYEPPKPPMIISAAWCDKEQTHILLTYQHEGHAPKTTVATATDNATSTLFEQAKSVATAYVPPAIDQAAANKAKRKMLLADTDPIADRDTRQNAAFTSAQMTALVGEGKAITPTQRKELEVYAQALRDMPETVNSWPSIKPSDWPAKPSWLDAMVKKMGNVKQ